jgi:hypothetical protein
MAVSHSDGRVFRFLMFRQRWPEVGSLIFWAQELPIPPEYTNQPKRIKKKMRGDSALSA